MAEASKHQLHEILAVEDNLSRNAQTIKDKTLSNFSKPGLFTGLIKEHQPVNESTPKQNTAFKNVGSTIFEQLDFLADNISGYYDAKLSKAVSNQTANADLVVNGQVLLEKVPATFLLEMEKELNTLVNILNTIPTRDPAVAWVPYDDDPREGIFRNQFVREAEITVKSVDYKVIDLPLEKKNQVKEINLTKIVGKYLNTDLSGAASSKDKAMMLSRLQNLIRCVKKARTRANQTELKTKHGAGKKLLDYVFSDKL